MKERSSQFDMSNSEDNESPSVQYYSEKDQGNFLYYGLLAYTVLFYSQLGNRFPVLSPLRLEFTLGSILLILSAQKIFSGQIELKENRLNYATIFFFIFLLGSIPFSLVKSRSLEAFIRIFKFFAIYLMIISTIDSEKKLKGFMFTYLSMCCLIFVQPFFLSLQGKGFVYNNHMWRLAGVTNYFAHPNQLGMITSANIPFFYYLMRWGNSKILKCTCFLLIIIALRVIMLTQSRTAFLGLLTFGFFIWLFSKKKFLGILGLIVAFAIIWQLSPQQTKDRFLTLGQSSRIISQGQNAFRSDEESAALGSMESRWILMQHAFAAFKENPLLGVGLDCFISFGGRRWDSWTPPHNTYLQALAEFGIIGFFALLWVVISTLKSIKESKRIVNEMKDENSFLSVTLSSTTMFYLIYLLTSFFGIEIYSNFWWLTGGLSVVMLRISKIKYEEYKKSEPKPQLSNM